jgi:hypothetical protein
MSTPYIPTTDALLDTFTQNFSSLITANPALYGLVAGDAVTIAGVVATFHTDYLAATNVSTRGPLTIANKDTARTIMLLTIRPYSQTIANNAGVTVGNKVALGLNPRTNPPTPVAAPTTAPALTLAGAIPLQHLLRFRDAMALPSVKAKPAGVIQMQLFAAVSPTVISDPTVLPQIMVVTKSPFVVDWPSSAVGKIAYYAAKWVTRTGLTGPYSAIFTATVM